MIIMDTFINEKDIELLNKDRYTFSVMKRIVNEKCALLLSDHERLVICFTGQPYPVWIWTPDGASEDEFERAYMAARENKVMDGDHRFNIKYELAEYFIKRAKKDGIDLKISTNLFAYDCPSPIVPSVTADGKLHQCTEDGIKTGTVYLWETTDGEFVASCNWHPANDMGSVGLVYTREEHRRKHYAEQIVYQVTKIVQDAGYMPMLYTDADYVASNACYEKIGYILRGKLCTIS